ncbi:glycosyltransferase [Haloferula chungangensis]|uniref:Glycosyltransferase n=1 Tax=Haloferula chungangensis TaxID=1048331 RepID=A0ABW2L9T2_9BACT
MKSRVSDDRFEKMIKISVIICTHNPRRDYLNRTLESLRNQSLSKAEWELLVIDNQSKVPVKNILSADKGDNIRVVVETNLGLTPARNRGIEESRGDLLIFIDDDNVVDPNYLSRAMAIMEDMPVLGCIGAGVLEPEFEEEPADSVRPYLRMLALRTVKETQWSNIPTDSIIPWGAGLVVRRNVAEKCRDKVKADSLLSILDRKGSALNSGGDNEFTWTACEMGYGKGLFLDLKIVHLIDRKRLQKPYLIKIAEGHAFSWGISRWNHLRETPNIPSETSCFDIVRSIARLRVSEALSGIQKLIDRRHVDAFASEIEAARISGRKRALKLIKEN